MLRRFLQKLILRGHLVVRMPNGRAEWFGDAQGELIAARVRTRIAAWKLALYPDAYLGECYMNGSLTMERGSICDLLDLIGINLAAVPRPHGWLHRSGTATLRQIGQINMRRAARRNVAHHYDLSEEFFRGFLDEDLQYSCAYFQEMSDTLEQAQLAKKTHIAAKLDLKPGQRILDIGCGWGGMALHLAQHADVFVHGISLSVEQLRICRQRVDALGLAHRVTFELQDYRDVRGSFDRIVSVGMLEHVGAPNYAAFFAAVERLLEPSGVALIHSIGRSFGPSYTSSFIRRYIFPGGYIPALSQLVPAFERAGLRLTDLEVLRLHYAATLRHWREQFLAEAKSSIDPRFRRMWEFYLGASEMSFRHLDFVVFQAQLTRRVDALPITRDYMLRNETHAKGTSADKNIAA